MSRQPSDRRRGAPRGLAPPVPVRRHAVIRGRQRWSLAPAAVPLLMEACEVLSEGEVRAAEGGSTFFGSTMITIDLDRAARGLRLEPDLDGPALAAWLARSAELRVRVLRLARLEAERRLEGALPGTMRAELVARASGRTVLIDVDVELPVDAGLRRRAGRERAT